MPWSWIRSKEALLTLSKDADYAEIVREMRARVDFWKSRFEDSSSLKCGWMHNYVCPNCASFLKFDADKPQAHTCPACGTTAENTKEVLEAWTYMRRYETEHALLDAAILYNMYGEESDRAWIVRVVDFYAEHYVDFEEYGKNAGRGRIMGQSLDEAVWAVNVLKALMIIGFDGKSEQGQRWLHRLFLPISRLVVAQTSMIHNIPLWHAVCAFCTGVFFGDERLARTTVEGELGLRNQILKGFTADGIWFENSTGYHYYAMHAATSMCVFARWAGVEDMLSDMFERVIAAYASLPRLRFRDKTMTAFNDSSRRDGDRGVSPHLDQYLEAARLFEGMPGAEAIAALLSGYDVNGSRGAFLYGIPEKVDAGVPTESIHLPHNCLGLLRGEGIEVFCKYGNLSRSHAHPDALQIGIPTFSCDLGNPGYGSPFHRGWYTQTLSHNTFLIDGANQRSDARGKGVLSEDGSAFALEVADAYEGVAARRDLAVKGGVLEDRMHVVCEAERQIDWVFHSEGDAAFEGSFTEATLPETENGYGYLKEIKRAEGAFAARFTIHGQTLTLTFDAIPEGAAIYLAKSPDNPANLQRNTVLVRVRAKDARIEARYALEGSRA